MRTAFIEELTIQARSNPRIFLVVGDLGFSVVENFASEFPDRFLNAGVAEQNMTGVAAGLASEGYEVFTYSIANFPTTRCLEQIRNDICYHNLPVTVVSVGGGVAYGSLGYSHHAVQDYAMLRGFPGMTIYSPGDPLETRAAVAAISRRPGPGYLRLGKNGEPTFHAQLPAIEGRTPAIIHVAGSSAAPNALLSTGAALQVAMAAFSELDPAEWSIWSMPIWDESGTGCVRTFVSSHQKVVSIEEHLGAGGFGSYLREHIGNDGSLQARLSSCFLDARVCGLVGSQNSLFEAGGLTSSAITNAMAAKSI